MSVTGELANDTFCHSKVYMHSVTDTYDTALNKTKQKL